MFSLEKAENVRFKAGGIRKSSNPLGEFHPVSYFSVQEEYRIHVFNRW